MKVALKEAMMEKLAEKKKNAAALKLKIGKKLKSGE
jgi:hypothetical protein